MSPTTTSAVDGRRPTRGTAAVAGTVAAAVALGVSELAAGLLGARSPVLAVADGVVDRAPGWLERAAIATLGTADKPVLVVGVLVVSALVGAALGLVARRQFALGAAGLTAFAAMGVIAASPDSGTSWGAALVVGAVGAGCGVVTLRQLLRHAPRDAPRWAGKAHARTSTADAVGDPAPVVADAGDAAPVVADAGGTSPATDLGRRTFLRLVAGGVALGAAAAVAGRWITSTEPVEQLRSALRLPRPARTAPPVPAGATLDVPGLTRLVTPNDEFFRIDTALAVPQVDPGPWRLSVEGLVDRPFSLSYEDLLAMPQVETDITLACVSNEVGGDLVGTARWQGVLLRDLLDRAGVRPGATQVLGRSVDGFTAGFPLSLALEVQDALVAVGMNGEPLPTAHGFPARLVVPGLYGYVSATKWLASIELTTFEEEVGYWIPRGWAREGPVKTQSRIDVPRPSATLQAGPQPVAGVAWAPTRGIERVEVRVDDGPWEEARLAESLDVDTWRQWVHRWEATPGRHVLTVRATDGTGEPQTDVRTAVAPDGASGHHTIDVVVEG